MSYRLPPLSIVVSSGSGSQALNVPSTFMGDCNNIGIRPPGGFANATGTISVTDSNGATIESNNFSGQNNFVGQRVHAGIVTVNLSGVSNDGTYTIDIWYS